MFLLFSLNAKAETFTLDRSIETALKYSPALKVQKSKSQQTDYSYRSAYGNALPQVSASYDIQNYLKKPSFGGFSLNSTYQRTLGVTVSQALYTFGAVSNAIDAAEAAVDISKLSESLTQRQVEYGVKVAFYTIHLAQQQLDIAEESLKNAKTNLSILQNYFASGRPPQQDHIRLRADVASRTSQVQDARKTLKQAKTSFKVLLGVPLETTVEIALPSNAAAIVQQAPQLKQRLLASQPQIRLLDKQIEYSESLAKVQESKIYPTLGAFYNFSLSERSDREFYDYDSQIDTSVIGLSLTWDLWNGGTNRAEISKAYAIKNEAEIKKTLEKDKLVEALENKMIEYNTLKENLVNDEESVRLAKESFRVSQNRFRTGKTSVTELNTTEALLYQTMLNKALHEFQLNESKAAIRQLVSEKSEG